MLDYIKIFLLLA